MYVRDYTPRVTDDASGHAFVSQRMLLGPPESAGTAPPHMVKWWQ